MLRLRPAQIISTSRLSTARFIPRIQHRRIAFRQPQAHDAATYQPVRFQRPRGTTRKWVIFHLFCLGGCYLWASKYLVPALEESEESESPKKKGNESASTKKKGSASPLVGGEEEDEDDGEYTFIPMTWGKQMPREFYRGSDPEWQEFVKVAKDQARRKKIQDALVQQVFKASKKHPAVQQHLGNDLKVGKYWLDISFPDGPPPEYKRYGLEIGDSEIYWASERISPEEQFRLQRALWPVAVLNATWAASKAVGGIHYRRVKQWLGVEGVDPFSPEERLRLALEIAEKQQNTKNQKGKRGSDDIDPAGAVVSRSTSTASDRPSSSDETKRYPWQIQVPMPSSSFDSSPGQQSMDFPIFQIVFQNTLQEFWTPKKIEPPRGSFVVQGMMEVRGSKGQILFDVKGCYDPKQAKYVMVLADKRNLKAWRQRPKGGP